MAIPVHAASDKDEIRDHQFFQIFLITISMAGFALALYATSPFGAGVSGDAANNLSTAENLLRGKGFFDLFGNPLVFWPPLYPILLAGLGLLTGDVVTGGWYLNILLIGLNIYLSGKLLYMVFRSQPLFQYISSLFVFLSVSSFRVYANIASDPLYITFSLLFLIYAGLYLERNSRSDLRAIFFYSALASLQRFVGIILIVIGGCLIIYKNWKNWKLMIQETLKFSTSASLPLVIWIIGHNLQYGIIAGNPSNIVQPWENVRMSLLKILQWFIPSQLFIDQIIKYPWALFITFVLVLIIINKRNNWLSWWKAVMSPYAFPAILFFFLSILTLIFSIATPDHRLLESDRYYIGLIVPVLILIFTIWEYLVFPHLKIRQDLSNKMLILFFVLWSLYPCYQLKEFIEKSRSSSVGLVL